jgi:hypothetical protein
VRTKAVLLGLALPLLTGGFGLTTLVLGAAVAALVPGPGGAPAGGSGPVPGADDGSGPALGGAGLGEAGPRPALPPGPMLGLYVSAAAGTCPGLAWSVLAAVGTVESDNAQSSAPGVHSGANAAGAEGPMQFEPATFAEYALPVPPGGVGPPSPYDPVDAVWAAARMLCANGAATGDLTGAVFSYNHSAGYVSEVLALAESIDKMAGAGS